MGSESSKERGGPRNGLRSARLSICLTAMLGATLLNPFGWSVAKAAEAQYQAPGQEAPTPEPNVVLQKMCDYLTSLNQFSFRTEVLDDEVYDGDLKLQYGMDMKTFVRRPDRLRVNAEGDVVNKQFFFNGKTITLYDKDDNVYGVMAVPPDIEGALEKAHEDFDVQVALTDLASPLFCEHISNGLEHSLYVGEAKVHGDICHHLALDRTDIHLQIWVSSGDQPLPRKIVITQKNLSGSPQWIAHLNDWDTSAKLPDKLFDFVPPSGVQKIAFVPVKQDSIPQSGKGGK